LQVAVFLLGGGGPLPSYAASSMLRWLRKKLVHWMLFSRSQI
jgi:hypothetical protein